MFFEMAQHLLSLAIGWFADLLMGNLFWVFAFIAIMYFFTEGRKVPLAAAILVVDIFALTAMTDMSGMIFLSGGFLGIYYITKIIFLKLVEDSKSFRRWMIPASAIHGLVLIVIYNWFMV